MNVSAISKSKTGSIPIIQVSETGDNTEGTSFSKEEKQWIKSNAFPGNRANFLAIPNAAGKISKVLFANTKAKHPFSIGELAQKLPTGKYRLEGEFDQPHLVALGWMLGRYRFTRYTGEQRDAVLVLPSNVSEATLCREASATYLARDLINIPANDMGPEHLEAEIRKLGKANKARVSVIKGDALLEKNFPMIHAVGRASTNAPRLIDLKWGKTNHPKVTLVGKGVTFDSGGLNIKPGNSMSLMKKDMGGAANTIALAKMIMEAKLPVRLRLLVPAVENSISGNAFRPGDVLQSRKGLTVEIGNTDAEGRLILGDALAVGDEEHPALMIDMATLTGAARVALGPELAPFYTDDEDLAQSLNNHANKEYDPVWRMPLWERYQSMLTSSVADVSHISSGGFAGSVTAALFLSRFVRNASSWVHFDIYGWNPSTKPWSPVGGEAQGIRALYKTIEQRFGN